MRDHGVRWWVMRMRTRELQWAWRVGEIFKRNSRGIWIGLEKWLNGDLWDQAHKRKWVPSLGDRVIVILLIEKKKSWHFKRMYIVYYNLNLAQLHTTGSSYPDSNWKYGCRNQKENKSKSMVSIFVMFSKQSLHTFLSP